MSMSLLINDKELFQYQVIWFDKQIKKIAIENFKVSGLSDKDEKISTILGGYNSIITINHLDELRALLSEKGLKKLSNSLASARKRKNSTKKSLQLMLSKETINKLENLAAVKSMSISEYLEQL